MHLHVRMAMETEPVGQLDVGRNLNGGQSGSILTSVHPTFNRGHG